MTIRLIPLLSLVLLVMAIKGGREVSAQGRISIKVEAIYASNTGGGTDPKLSRLQGQLSSLFNYSTYKLMDVRRLSLKIDEEGVVPLPGNRSLEIVPKQSGGGVVQISVAIKEAGGYILTTDFRVVNRGTILVGGPKDREGVLIIAITVEM